MGNVSCCLMHISKRQRDPRIIIIDNFCVTLFSGVHNLTVLYNILQHFLSKYSEDFFIFKVMPSTK